jgi:hypothetical protein
LVYPEGDFTAPREDINLRKRFKWAFESEDGPSSGGQHHENGRLRVTPVIHENSTGLSENATSRQFHPIETITDPCVPDLEAWWRFRDLFSKQSVS